VCIILVGNSFTVLWIAGLPTVLIFKNPIKFYGCSFNTCLVNFKYLQNERKHSACYIYHYKLKSSQPCLFGRELLVKWGYYLELKGEADRLLEVTRSRFPTQEVTSQSELGKEMTVYGLAGIPNHEIYAIII
jgi:hypothetical protein